MVNIITAIGNEKLNNRLKEEKNIKILEQDIQYQEGIIEFLNQKTKKLDYIILSETIQGNTKIEDFIEQIISDEYYVIVIIKDKNDKTKINYLLGIGVYKILFNNETKYEEILELIQKKRITRKTKAEKELEEIKELLIKNKINIEKLKKKGEKHAKFRKYFNINKREKSNKLKRTKEFLRKYIRKSN
jgi:hypothetical protein